MKHGNKLVAIGRSRFLYDTIKHLANLGSEIIAVITDEAYEEYDIKTADFQQLAAEIGATCFLTKNLADNSIREIIQNHNIKIGFSVNWKYTIPEDFIRLFEHGILNLHLGNLPDYKGNATANWSIINGEDHIYANIHRMEPELDIGDVIARKRIPITSETYISDILKAAESDAPKLFQEAITKTLIEPGYSVVKGSKQGLRCYPRLSEDSQINWNDSIDRIDRLVRASSRPYSGAFCYWNNKKLIIWKAKPYKPTEKFLAVPGHVVEINKINKTIMVACKDGFLELQEIEFDNTVLASYDLIKSIRVRLK